MTVPTASTRYQEELMHPNHAAAPPALLPVLVPGAWPCR